VKVTLRSVLLHLMIWKADWTGWFSWKFGHASSPIKPANLPVKEMV